MQFIVVLHTDDHEHYGATVPDLPGCFSGGDSLGEVLESVQEAIDLHVMGLIEEGHGVPKAKSIAEHHVNPDFAGGIWAVVNVPVERYYGPAEKLNITLPKLLLAQIDDYTRAHGLTRSGFLAHAAQTMMRDAG